MRSRIVRSCSARCSASRAEPTVAGAGGQRSEIVAFVVARRGPVPLASSTAAVPRARPKQVTVTGARSRAITSRTANTSSTGPPGLLTSSSIGSPERPSRLISSAAMSVAAAESSPRPSSTVRRSYSRRTGSRPAGS